jgi:hypothetical protein
MRVVYVSREHSRAGFTTIRALWNQRQRPARATTLRTINDVGELAITALTSPLHISSSQVLRRDGTGPGITALQTFTSFPRAHEDLAEQNAVVF